MVSSWYGGAERTVEIVSETAIWYSTGLPAVPIRWVLIRDPEGDFESQALLCTDLDADPAQIISWFVRRWQMESTFQEVRQRLGFETHRHWSEMAIQRTAPALLALFSVVTLFAHQKKARMPQAMRKAAWYDKRHPTFSDALALVRRELWTRTRGGFLRVGAANGDGKSPARVHGKADRCGLLCSIMAKVALQHQLCAMTC
jgi:hypothetical protein